jgi:hypothetical protein
MICDKNGFYLLADEITFLECVVKCIFLYLKYNFNELFKWRHGWGKQMWNTAKWYDIHVRQKPILDYLIHVINF